MRDNMHSWDKQFSPRTVSRGIGRDSIGAVGMVEKKMAWVWTKIIIHIDMETTDSVLRIQTSRTLSEKPETFISIKEKPYVVLKGKKK